MTVLVFFLLLLVLLILPFVPAIVEVRRRADALPLQVVRNYDVNVKHFAHTFGRYIEAHFAPALAEPDAKAVVREGELEDGSRYQILGPNEPLVFDAHEQTSQVTTRLIVAIETLRLPGAMSYLNELYAGGTVYGADEDIYRAVLAGGDIYLGEKSLLLRWMHASGDVVVSAGCVLHGRVSADTQIQLAPDCRFERLYAPRIVFAGEPAALSSASTPQRLDPQGLPCAVEVGAGRWLIEEDVVIPPHSRIDADLVVVGRLTLGEHCEIHGAIKSHKKLQIGKGCRIHGSVVSMAAINIDTQVSIKGPLVSERKIDLASHGIIGLADKPTTITAETITIHPGCLAHGTVWARRLGMTV